MLEILSSAIDFVIHIDKYLEVLIQNYGTFVYLFLFLIVFLETGIVLTPFLPGDSLLFVAGAFAGVGSFNIYVLIILLSIAAVLGDTMNYFLGKFFGERVFSRFIKAEHMEKTRVFYAKYGKKTIIFARFVPIVRTFAPFVAGIGKMDYFTFLSYNFIGGIMWVSLFTLAGYFFGAVPIIAENLTKVIFIIIFVSFIPIIIEYIKHKRAVKKESVEKITKEIVEEIKKN